MATISSKNIAQAIYLELKGKEQNELPVVFNKIVQFLAKKRLLNKASDIIFRLSKIINEEEGKVAARVSSRTGLDEKTKNELKSSLMQRYKAKDVDFIFNTDEKLLGGFKIEVNDEVIDLTVKNKIDKLQEYLKKSV